MTLHNQFETAQPYFFLVRANTPRGGVTRFLKVGDWFFGRTPSTLGGVRQNPKSGLGAEGAKNFFEAFFTSCPENALNFDFFALKFF